MQASAIPARHLCCTGPPFVPSAVPSWLPSAFRQRPWCSCVWGAAADGVLSGAWYGFAVAPRCTSSGHAIHVCATGAAASCAPRAGRSELAIRHCDFPQHSTFPTTQHIPHNAVHPPQHSAFPAVPKTEGTQIRHRWPCTK
jgi:hypothetical protein